MSKHRRMVQCTPLDDDCNHAPHHTPHHPLHHPHKCTDFANTRCSDPPTVPPTCRSRHAGCRISRHTSGWFGAIGTWGRGGGGLWRAVVAKHSIRPAEGFGKHPLWVSTASVGPLQCPLHRHPTPPALHWDPSCGDLGQVRQNGGRPGDPGPCLRPHRPSAQASTPLHEVRPRVATGRPILSDRNGVSRRHVAYDTDIGRSAKRWAMWTQDSNVRTD